MANERTERSHKRWEDHGAGGASSEPTQNMGNKAEGSTSQGESQLRQGMESARSGMAASYEQAGEWLSQYPAPAVAFGFGMGFGLGLFLALAMRPEPKHRSWTDWAMPDSVRDLPQHLRRLSDSISDSVSSYM